VVAPSSSTESDDRIHDLTEWLAQLRGNDPLDGVDDLTRARLRPAAGELLAGPPLSSETIAEIAESTHLTVLRAAIALRGREVLAHWKPLLTACRSGRAAAPLRDLKSVIGEARALELALEGATGYGGDRELGLQRLRTLLQTLEGYLPAENSGSFKHARYETLTHHDKPTTKRRAWYLEALRAETKLSEPRTALLFGTLLALAGLYFFINQGFEAVLPEGPPPQVEAYRRALPETQSRNLADGDLTVIVHSSWASKPRSVQLDELMALRGATRKEEFDLLIVETEQGRTIVRVTRDGDFTWLNR
jgi:hypothetical protein